MDILIWIWTGIERVINEYILIYQMEDLIKYENYLTLENLNNARSFLVPHIFSRNYFDILKEKLRKKKLSENERYYYNHFIKKKLRGMIKLFDITHEINGKEFIIKGRLKKAINLLNKYSRKHRNMKMFISGSFLYDSNYNDIDIFVISKYGKEDYRDGKVHINYLPADAEKTLFFKSAYKISITNFKSDEVLEEEFKIEDILHYYELVILLIMQKNYYLPELRDLIIRAEYISNRVILNSMQLRIITDRIIKSKNPISILNKYIIVKLISSYSVPILKRALREFVDKNSRPEKGHKIYENWKIYNQTYKEVLKIVA